MDKANLLTNKYTKTTKTTKFEKMTTEKII